MLNILTFNLDSSNIFASKRVSVRQNVSYKTNLRMKKVKAFTDDRWELLHEYSSNRVERLKCFQCSKTWNKGFTVDIYFICSEHKLSLGKLGFIKPVETMFSWIREVGTVMLWHIIHRQVWSKLCYRSTELRLASWNKDYVTDSQT